ncbi:S1C family serine protease [Kitasatospora viridis]|uniref:Putative serine protease PepD n=1 Tax=Kitasatospora viridis TaxID=281105 RepID=A0A561UI10_9ACTN|nr:trypsin-like peptidase domain-containing protein [Kitasatospora viridis]TWF98980.1 putative serine protease PepD [Kitasatospora viridis]
MSTEHESGSTGPQGEQLSSGHGEPGGTPAVGGAAAGEPTPTVAFGRVTPPEQPAEAAQADEAAEPAGEVTPTVVFGKVTPPEPQPEPAPQASDAPSADAPSAAAEYLDAPPPELPAAADSRSPFAPPAADPAPTAPGYLDAPPPVLPPSPVQPAPAAESPGNPYAVPTAPVGAPTISAGVPAASALGAEGHHPFGAGHPVGDTWGGGPGAPGGPGFPGYPGGEYPGGYPQPPRKKGKGGLIALVAAVALVAGLAGGVAGAAFKGNSSNSAGGHSSTTVSVAGSGGTSRAPDSIAGIAAKATPSVVTIKAVGSSESGIGTGFVFDTQGRILTNNHVVAPAANGGKLTVKFSDGSTYPASVVGQAKGYDVAVIKIDNPPAGKLVPLPLADSDQVQVGDPTIAIGAPFDLEDTVTSGIVSAKNRPVASGDEAGTQVSYMSALQTDASINPGNSGGPLLNGQGAVIGIDSAIQSSTQSSGSGGQAGSIGLGFAIPINQAKKVAEMLIQTGTPVYATLGILRNDDYQNGDGAQIMTSPVQGTAPVTAGGPADKAGLKPGDVITKLGNTQIDGSPALVATIWSHSPGDQVQVQYLRNGQPGTTTVTLGSRSGDTN